VILYLANKNHVAFWVCNTRIKKHMTERPYKLSMAAYAAPLFKCVGYTFTSINPLLALHACRASHGSGMHVHVHERVQVMYPG
jgi:hypothetical protein